MELNVKSFSGIILTVALAAFLVVTLFIPMTASGTTETLTYENEGMRASLYQPGDTHTIIMDANGIKTDDGEYQPYPDTSRYGEATILFGMGDEGDSYRGNVVRLSGSNSTIYEYLYIGGTYSNRAIAKITDVPITVTIDETGTATLTPETGTVRRVSNVMIYPDAEGDYSLTYNPKITEGTTVYGAGNTAVADLVYGLRFNGTTDDLTFRVISPSTGEVSSYDASLKKVTTNLMEVEDIAVTMDDSQVLHYSYIFAPREIEYDNPGYTPTTSTIIGIIPILILAGLVIGVVGMVIARRD